MEPVTVYIGGKHKIPQIKNAQGQDFWHQICFQGLVEIGEEFIGFVQKVAFTMTPSSSQNLGHRLKGIYSIGEIKVVDINTIDNRHIPDLVALAKIIEDYAQKLSKIPTEAQVKELLPAFTDSSWRIDRSIEVTDDGKIIVGWSIYIRYKRDHDRIIAYKDFKCKGNLDQVVKRCDADGMIQQATKSLEETSMRKKWRLIDDEFEVIRQHDRVKETDTLEDGLTNVTIQGIRPTDIPAILDFLNRLSS
jgi:hypothetical protein